MKDGATRCLPARLWLLLHVEHLCWPPSVRVCYRLRSCCRSQCRRFAIFVNIKFGCLIALSSCQPVLCVTRMPQVASCTLVDPSTGEPDSVVAVTSCGVKPSTGNIWQVTPQVQVLESALSPQNLSQSALSPQILPIPLSAHRCITHSAPSAQTISHSALRPQTISHSALRPQNVTE